MSRVEFTTELLKERNVVRLWVPGELAAELGSARLLPALVTVNGQAVQTTLHKMGGGYMMAVSKDLQQRFGVGAGDSVRVTVEPDAAERAVQLPDDLVVALAESNVRNTFDQLSLFRQTELVKAVTSARQAQTRARRISQVIEGLSK